MTMLLGLVSCQSPQPQIATVAAPTRTPPPDLTIAAPITSAPRAATTSPASKPVISQSENPFSGGSAAIERLGSYRYRVFSRITQPDTQTSNRFELQGERSGDRERLAWADPSSNTPFELIRTGQNAMLNSGSGWTTLPADQVDAATRGVLTLRQVWQSLAGDLARTSQLVGEETINGIKTYHYTSTSQSWTQLSFAAGSKLDEAHGDVWMARDGEFPLKAQFSARGTNAHNQPVVLELGFELLDVNEPVGIDTPK